MSAVLSEWKPTAVVTVGVALVSVQTLTLWITGTSDCVVIHCVSVAVNSFCVTH